MVLRDSFLANEKVKIVMLTCICPGMSSANHTLNSLRYAERLKEKGQGGQGASVHKGFKANGLTPDQVTEELRIFLEKHGKTPTVHPDEENRDKLKNAFYQEDAIVDELMD